MDILGPLAALGFSILIDYRELGKCPRLLLMLLLPLTSLSGAWWVRTRNLRIDVALVEVRHRTSQIDLSLAELVLVRFDQLKLSLSHTLFKILTLAYRDTKIQIIQFL